MIKKILSMAIIVAAACGISASAQQNKMYQPQQFTDFAFEGILLDVDQQAKIDNINSAFRLKGQPAAENAQCDKQNCPKQPCDSANCDQPKRQRNRGQMPSPANDPNMRREYAKQVKQVLTPEQYTQFLENIAFMPQGMQRFQGADARRGHKAGKVKDGARNATRTTKAAKKDDN